MPSWTDTTSEERATKVTAALLDGAVDSEQAARALPEIFFSKEGDTWTLTTKGGSVAMVDHGNGTALAGDWDCDGSDPWAAFRLYRAMDTLAAALGLDVSIHTEAGNDRLDRLYKRLGWTPSHIIYHRNE